MPQERVLREIKNRMDKTLEFFQNELAGIRTGKASPALVENMNVDYYGTVTRLREIAGISTPEPRLILIQPWDPGAVSAITKMINTSSLGITPISDGKVIRLPIPELDEERRKDLTKTTKRIAEDDRVAIRNIRRETNDELKKLQKDGQISEDDFHRLIEEIQKITDEHIKKIDDLLKAKEYEIMEV